MRDPRTISIKDYSYSLPEEKIAAHPLDERDASRLLVYKKGVIATDTYRDISKHLPPASLLVFNNTKVVAARILFQKPTGGWIEIFCLEPHENYPDITTAMHETGKVSWLCLVGGASKWKRGQALEKKIVISSGREIILTVNYLEKRKECFVIELSWSPPELNFAELLLYAGAVPLPPYIKRTPESSDTERYQTIYAASEGSVAAPTAGLHFTEKVFHELDEMQIRREFVTLHVGAGTFRPVKSATMEQHEMHAEWIDVSGNTIANIITHIDQDIVAVGTTSLRTLESLYWIGVKLLATHHPLTNDASPTPPVLSQWEAYELSGKNIPVKPALQALLAWMEQNRRDRFVTKTQILIVPGYQFKIVKGLITNFHQPQSTLLLLVAALIGEDWRKVYEHALQNNFRFLSYGDGCLLWGEAT